MSATITNNFYNVPARADGTDPHFIWGDAAGAHDITVPAGQYDLLYFVSVVLPALKLAASPLNILVGTIDAVTQKVMFTTTDATMNIVPSRTLNEIAWLLGVVGPDNINIVFTSPFTFNKLPKFDGPGVCSIHCENLSTGTSDFDRSTDIHSILEVRLDQPFGHLCTFETGELLGNTIQYPSLRFFSHLKFQLRDSYGKELDIHDGFWLILFKVYYLK